MSVLKVRRIRSLVLAWLLAASLAVAQAAVVVADSSGGPFPR
jgi:hypothetical protein